MKCHATIEERKSALKKNKMQTFLSSYIFMRTHTHSCVFRIFVCGDSNFFCSHSPLRDAVTVRYVSVWINESIEWFRQKCVWCREMCKKNSHTIEKKKKKKMSKNCYCIYEFCCAHWNLMLWKGNKCEKNGITVVCIAVSKDSVHMVEFNGC